jgi:hypothetical protein
MGLSQPPSRAVAWPVGLIAALMGVVLALLAWWWPGGGPPTTAVASAGVPQQLQTPTALPPPVDRQQLPIGPSEPSQPRPSSTHPPQGLGAEQLQQLRASLAHHPQREAEVARVSAYLQYSAQWQHFTERRAAGARADELRPLAAALDAGLAQRLQQREVSAGEALHIKAALLEVLEPDAAQRQAALREWRERHSAASAAGAAPDPQTAAFERRQAEIVAQWRALPPGERDPQRLEAELEALRQSSFAAPPTAPTTTPPAGDRR